MKLLSTALLAATLFAGLAITGCETSHTESDKPGLLGGSTHTETTTTQNPITGQTTTDQQKTSQSGITGNTTTSQQKTTTPPPQ